MSPSKSLDEVNLIAALLCDVSTLHGAVFNSAALTKTLRKVRKRVASEGLGFLTKTLPRLGKAFDKALTGDPLDSIKHGFKSMSDSQLPIFIGELFSQVLAPNGTVLPNPCTKCVSAIRTILYSFGKYELPNTEEQEQQVIDQFKRTDESLKEFNAVAQNAMSTNSTSKLNVRVLRDSKWVSVDKDVEDIYLRRFVRVKRRASTLLARLFARFDPSDIYPRHGPGAVATKQKLWDKYVWTNVSAKIRVMYPLEAYFCASLSHYFDRPMAFSAIGEADLPARVILVPKDSRGPRLISCEPVDYQWIQQGLGRAIVRHVERERLTKSHVFFTDQSFNQRGALLGSMSGKYATLDLNEASDRISTGLVHLLFPPNVIEHLMASRSSSTVLPDGQVLTLEKYAPMGSCLCFPVMALCIWAILTAAAPDADARESILVYGDDVIVKTAYAADAITWLEAFGLKINRAKSCTSGLFRESCGTDAFQGVDVTPVRIRTVWESSRSPDVYLSWIAYANSYWDRQYYAAYDLIVGELHRIYGDIPSKDMNLSCPSLAHVPEEKRPKRRRANKGLQKLQWYVRDVKSPKVTHEIDGWSMLLRYFADKGRPEDLPLAWSPSRDLYPCNATSVSEYTRRCTGMLVYRWR